MCPAARRPGFPSTAKVDHLLGFSFPFGERAWRERPTSSQAKPLLMVARTRGPAPSARDQRDAYRCGFWVTQQILPAGVAEETLLRLPGGGTANQA
jgi:hypothetical protein